MDSLELLPIQTVSPTLAETIRGCRLRAGLSKVARSYEFVLGNPIAWLGTAYHEVLERIGDIDFSHASFESAAERLWQEAVSAQYHRSMRHALDRRYGLPVTWPGYYVAKASAFLRAAELAATPFGEGAAKAKLDAKQSGVFVREQKLTALDGKLVGRPDVILDRKIVDYKSGSIFEQGEATLTEVAKAAYVRQLRIYGFLVQQSLGYLPERGVLLPIAGAGVEIALDPDTCAREAVEAVAILDGYNTRLATASEITDLANPSPDVCKWCPFKLLCQPFWKSASPDWSRQLDGAAVEGVVDEAPLSIQGGAAMAVSININAGSESSNRLQVAPLNPSTQLAAAVASGDRVRLVGLRTRNDGSLVPSQRTILARVEDLPTVSIGHGNV